MNQQEGRSSITTERPPSAPEPRSNRVSAGAPQAELAPGEPPDFSAAAAWTAIDRVAIVGMALIVAIVALYLARSIVMPVAAALLIGISLRPVQVYLARYGVPPVITALVLIAAFFGMVYGIVTLVVGSLGEWIAQAPDIGSVIQQKLRWLERPLTRLRELQDGVGVGAGAGGGSVPKVALETSLPTMVQTAAGILTPALSELLVFFGALLFFMIGTEKLRRQLITSFETRDARRTVVRIWGDIEHNLIMYLGTVTAINLGVGAATVVMLFVVGFPNALAFGVLAFVLNYIPYLGPTMVVLALFGMGLIASPTLGGAVLPPLLFVAIVTVEGQFITPSIVGRRLTLSPFLVFLALAFWTWLWGPLGAFLATPLLIVGLVALGHLFPRDEVMLPK